MNWPERPTWSGPVRPAPNNDIRVDCGPTHDGTNDA
jgi:hypothetical protein